MISLDLDLFRKVVSIVFKINNIYEDLQNKDIV